MYNWLSVDLAGAHRCDLLSVRTSRRPEARTRRRLCGANEQRRRTVRVVVLPPEPA
jgi:hypothetical protein